VSTKHQEETGDSLRSQKDECKKWIRIHYPMLERKTKIYSDTGSAWKGREHALLPNLQTIVDCCECALIVIDRVDRLLRNVEAAKIILPELKRKNNRIVFVLEQLEYYEYSKKDVYLAIMKAVEQGQGESQKMSKIQKRRHQQKKEKERIFRAEEWKRNHEIITHPERLPEMVQRCEEPIEVKNIKSDRLIEVKDIKPDRLIEVKDIKSEEKSLFAQEIYRPPRFQESKCIQKSPVYRLTSPSGRLINQETPLQEIKLINSSPPQNLSNQWPPQILIDNHFDDRLFSKKEKIKRLIQSCSEGRCTIEILNQHLLQLSSVAFSLQVEEVPTSWDGMATLLNLFEICWVPEIPKGEWTAEKAKAF
jgi:DNA invertase Pin-like site-specific DNA recombinase